MPHAVFALPRGSTQPPARLLFGRCQVRLHMQQPCGDTLATTSPSNPALSKPRTHLLEELFGAQLAGEVAARFLVETSPGVYAFRDKYSSEKVLRRQAWGFVGIGL